MLLKVALLLGIEIHVNVDFKGLIEPPEDQENESKCLVLLGGLLAHAISTKDLP